LVFLKVAVLHSETIPRSSSERPKGSFLVVRESFIEALGAFREPALREETVGFHEVVRRMVSGEMRHADANLLIARSAWSRQQRGSSAYIWGDIETAYRRTGSCVGLAAKSHADGRVRSQALFDTSR
jgi:hypothetical protein